MYLRIIPWFLVMLACLLFMLLLCGSAVYLLNFIISMAFISGHQSFWSSECLQLCFFQMFLAQNSKPVTELFFQNLSSEYAVKISHLLLMEYSSEIFSLIFFSQFLKGSINRKFSFIFFSLKNEIFHNNRTAFTDGIM